MVVEAFGFFACVLILMLIGFGPALATIPVGDKHVAYAVSIAPALGLAIVGIVSFPLVRYVAPVQNWAWPLTIALVAVSTTLVIYDWRQNRVSYSTLPDKRSTLLTVGLMLGCLFLLVSPMLAGGIQYAVFLRKHSDAFLYMSLAETLRHVDWLTLVAGANFRNISDMVPLASESPTSVFSARFVLIPVRLTTMIVFAWAAELVNLPIHRFFYAYNLISFAVVPPIILVIGDQLKLPKILCFGAASALVVGFWAQVVKEHDASTQINSIPLSLLIVFAWIQLEQRSKLSVTQSCILLAVAYSAIMCYYPEFLPLLVIAVVLYYGIGLLQKSVGFQSIFNHSLTFVIALLILSASGQIVFHLRALAHQISFITSGMYAYESDILLLFLKNKSWTTWGIPTSLGLSKLPDFFQPLLQASIDYLVVFLSVSIITAFVFASRPSAPVSDRILFSLIAGGLVLFLRMVFTQNDYSAGKALAYIYPFFTLSVLLSARQISTFKHITPRLRSLLRPAFTGLLGIWLGLQVCLGFYWPYLAYHQETLILTPPLKPEKYDLSAITSYLDRHQPELLLVNIPREETWTFAYYSMFVFSKYSSYFQSGIITDNSKEARNLWFAQLDRVPDYAVVSKNYDYIGAFNLGSKLAETDDLTLYKISTKDTELFRIKSKGSYRKGGKGFSGPAS